MAEVHERPEDLVRSARLGSAMFARIDPPIFLVTAKHEERESGAIITWVCSATLLADRPRVIVAISPTSLTAELIRGSERFVLHLLAQEQAELVPRFGLGSGREHDKLEGLTFERSDHGIAILPGVAGHAECEVAGRLVVAEREVIIATVADEAANLDVKPLTLDEAYKRLPAEIVAAIEEQAVKDGERDSIIPLRGFLH